MHTGETETSKSSTFPRSNTSGGRGQRPRSFFGGSFEYDHQFGGLRPATQGSETHRKRRPASWIERSEDEGSNMVLGDLTNFSKSAKLNDVQADSDTAKNDRGFTSKARPDFLLLNSQEKANAINKDRDEIKMEVSQGGTFRDRLNSMDDETKKAAKQLYTELSSPPKKVGETESISVVGRLRNMFDASAASSAPRMSSITVDSSGKARTYTHQISVEKESPQVEGTHDNLGPVVGRRRTFEKIEAERKRKIFAPPAPVKLDDLLRRDAPITRRSSDERKNENRRTSGKDKVPVPKPRPVKSDKATVSGDSDTEKKSEPSNINGVADDIDNVQPRYRIPSISELKSEYLHNIRSGKGGRLTLERRQTDESIDTSSISSNADVPEPKEKIPSEKEPSVETGSRVNLTDKDEVIKVNDDKGIPTSEEKIAPNFTQSGLTDNLDKKPKYEINGTFDYTRNDNLNMSEEHIQAMVESKVETVDNTVSDVKTDLNEYSENSEQELMDVSEELSAVTETVVESVPDVNSFDDREQHDSSAFDEVKDDNHLSDQGQSSETDDHDKSGSDNDSDSSLSSGHHQEDIYEINPASDAEEPTVDVEEVGETEQSPDYVNEWVINDVKNKHQSSVQGDKVNRLSDATLHDDKSNEKTDSEFETSGEFKEDEEVQEEEYFIAESTVELPPPPSRSCLARQPKYHVKNRRVTFFESPSSVIATYSPWEYDRANVEIDPVTASAEWELEKRVDKMDLFSVDLEKDERGLGLSIIGLGVGTESGVEKLGIFVKSLTKGGAAYRDGRIQVQDQILEVNGVSLVGVTQQFAAQTLKNTNGSVRFLMGREKNKKHYQAPTSGANPDLQALEQKHNQELNELLAKLQDTEERAALAENELYDLKDRFLVAEDRATQAETELQDLRQELDVVKQKPHEPRRSSLKIDQLEKAMQEMSEKLNTSEENLEKVASEKNDISIRLKEREENCENLRRENESLIQLLNEKTSKITELEESYGNLHGEHSDLIKHVDAYKERYERLQRELEVERESKVGQEIMDRFTELEELNRQHVNEVEELRAEKDELSAILEQKDKELSLVSKDLGHFRQMVNKLERQNEQQMELNEKLQIEFAAKETDYEEEIEELHMKIRELSKKKTKLEEPEESTQIMVANPAQEVVASFEKKVESAEDSSESSDEEDEEVIVVAELNVEEQAPDFSFIEKSGSLDSKNSKLMEQNLDAVNPVPKPPRRPSAENVLVRRGEPVSVVVETETAPPQPRKETVEEDAVVQEKAEIEKEVDIRRQSMLNAFEKLNGETSEIPIDTQRKIVVDSKNVIEDRSDISDRPNKPNELIFADLPESNVDSPDMSDDDVLSDFKPSVAAKLDVEHVETETVVESEPETVVLKPKEPNIDLSLKTVECDKTNDTSTPEKPSSLTNVKFRTDPVNKDADRSSFLESLKLHPSFKSMFDGGLSMSIIMDTDRSEETADEIAKQMVEGKERDRSSSTSSSKSNSSVGSKHDEESKQRMDRAVSIQLDESYLQKSPTPRTLDPDDLAPSPLLRLGSSLEKLDEVPEKSKPAAPMVSDFNFDDIPTTPTLDSSAQYDKRNVAKALPKKTPKRSASSPPRPVVVVEPLPQQPKPQYQFEVPPSKAHSNAERAVDVPSDMEAMERTSSASASSVAVAQDRDHDMEAERDKRRSKFGFHFPKGLFGGKKNKKKAKSMENLLGTDPMPRGNTTGADLRRSVGDNLHRQGVDDDDESVVPLSETNSQVTDSSQGANGVNPSSVDDQMKYEARLKIHIPPADYPSSETSSGVPSSSASPVTEDKLKRFSMMDEADGDTDKDGTLQWTKRPVVDWDVRQVGMWLIGLEMEQYVKGFQDHDINGLELLALNGSKLKDLGVLDGEHRAIIKKRIRDFRDQRKGRDSKRDPKSKDNKLSKKVFWKGKYTINS